jgi:hypothetical protein
MVKAACSPSNISKRTFSTPSNSASAHRRDSHVRGRSSLLAHVIVGAACSRPGCSSLKGWQRRGGGGSGRSRQPRSSERGSSLRRTGSGRRGSGPCTHPGGGSGSGCSRRTRGSGRGSSPRRTGSGRRSSFRSRATGAARRVLGRRSRRRRRRQRRARQRRVFHTSARASTRVRLSALRA